MEVAVFIPIGNNGWLISRNGPQYMLGEGVNTPAALTPDDARTAAAAQAAGRAMGVYALFMIIAGADARARWESYKEGRDEAAIPTSARDKGAYDQSSSRRRQA